MFTFLRRPDVVRSNTATHNPIIYEEGRASVEFHAPNSHYIMTHRLPPTTPEHGASLVEPPFHYHIYQTEYFNVQAGTGYFYMGLDPKPFITLSAEEGKPKNATIPAGRYHRFENASKTEDLLVDVHLTPENYENEQKFFRNFFGHLNDCKLNKRSPSFFQLMVFLHDADTPLALPLPWEWLGRAVSRVFLIGVAFYGRWVLGYKTSYPEYYEAPKTR